MDALTAVKALRAPPTLDQVKGTRAQTLLADNPPDFTDADKLLFGERLSTNRRRIIEEPVLGPDGYPTGAKRFHSVDLETGESVPVELPGAGQGQGQAPAGAIEKLRRNPALAADFQRKYGYLPAGL